MVGTLIDLEILKHTSPHLREAAKERERVARHVQVQVQQVQPTQLAACGAREGVQRIGVDAEQAVALLYAELCGAVMGEAQGQVVWRWARTAGRRKRQWTPWPLKAKVRLRTE